MMTFPRFRRSVRGACAAVAFLSLVGCAAVPSGGADQDPDLALYRDVIARVQSDYVEPVGENKLVTNSLKGMLTGLDPHSDFMDERDYHDMLSDSQGEFAGIGAELTREDNRPKIISPIDDTPAARAGLKSGDIIARIDGKSTDGLSLKEAVDELRGPAGSKVRITVNRNGQAPFDVTLTRAVIHVVSVKSKLEPGRIGYVRISTFAEKTQQELLDAIDALKRQAGGRLEGFVLDLRNDPGGLLDTAVRVAGDFIDGGAVVTTHGRDPDDDRVYRAPPSGDRIEGVPMVVLINGASASASEIVAGALQDHHRATLIGSRSFGKGSVQTIIPMEGRGALRLTTARYYTPSGRSIQGDGISPDVVVLPPKDEQIASAEIVHEGDLNGALRNTGPLSTSTRPPASPTQARQLGAADERAEASIDPSLIGTAKDYQLAVAIKHLRDAATRHTAARQR